MKDLLDLDLVNWTIIFCFQSKLDLKRKREIMLLVQMQKNQEIL